jgi:hypothetical protein
MQGIVVETREVSPNHFRAEVVDGPVWALRHLSLETESRIGAYSTLRDELRAKGGPNLSFIHVPE